MEIQEEKIAEGGVYLRREDEVIRYRWEYWMGVTLWTGCPIIFTRNIDFRCEVGSFANQCNRMGHLRGVKTLTSKRGLPAGQISVIWCRHDDVYLGRPTETKPFGAGLDPNEIIIPEMRTGYIIPELLEGLQKD